jgi:inner membrane protein
VDNITHTLAGALLGQMGLKRRSRFAFAACLLGANAPDIDVFAPLVLPVEGIQFHRGPIHAVFAWPVLAAGIVAIFWLLDRLRPAPPGTIPFRAGPLFVVAFLAVLTHPFLDWLTTYAIALLAPADWRWSSGDAIFIVDWVYWVLMIAGISWSAIRWRRHAEHPGRPAQIAGLIMLGYISFNLGESARLEHATAERLRAQGIEPTLIVASPPPFAFWNRRMLWRSSDRWGSGAYDLRQGLTLDPASHPTNLDDPRLAAAARRDPHLRAFLVWSRMPIVVTEDGKAYLTDQRFFGQTVRIGRRSTAREAYRYDPFLIPLDNPGPSS